MTLAEIVWNQQTLAVVMIFSIPIIAIIGGIWHKTEAHKSDNELKRSMVERGMSPDDIQRVLEMTPGKKPESPTLNVNQNIRS